MTSRSFSDFTPLAVLMAASLGAAGLAGCSPHNPEPAAGAAPATTDTSANRASGATETPAPVAAADSTSTAAAPTGAAPDGATAPVAADTQWVKWDPATKTVTFRLVAGPFEWNGYTNGKATLTVPGGSTNVINFEQNDGTPHSAEIDSGTGPIPNSGGNPAIPRAYTNKVVEGLPQGATDVMRFTAPDTGTFRLICGVPGHALSGMWIWYKVDPAAKEPTFGPTKE